MEIYLDNAATTHPIADAAFMKHISDAWYNPSAAYAPAAKVFIDMKKPRQKLCEITGIDGDVIFTSGGTEACNTVVMSAFKKNAHYITTAVEHPAVYAAFKHIESLGADVDYIRPNGHGISVEDVAALVREDTVMVSVMHVNNETGARYNVPAMCRAVKAKNPETAFYSDGVQALFKTECNLSGSGIDYYTVSAHKINALKGTGAIIAAKGSALKKLHHGGSQEFSLRPGTENTLGIQVFSEALERGQSTFADTLTHCTALSKRLTDGLGGIEDATLNLQGEKVPHIVNVSFSGVRAEVLVRVLGQKGIYIGTGAACSRGKTSRVLTESGISKQAAECAVRISLGAQNTKNEIDTCLEEIDAALRQMRKLRRR